MKKWISLILSFTIVLLSGCNNHNNDAIERDQGQSNIISVKNSTTNHIDRKTGQQIARHLVELAKSVPNVNDATAVVVGKYAVVGIDVDSKLERSRVSTIKYTVTEALKKDPYGANAVVIADSDTNQRLKQMGKEIQNGKPISGIIEELADIVGRIVPEVPNDMIKNKKPNPTNENNKQLNRKEKNELENEQQDQSNHYK